LVEGKVDENEARDASECSPVVELGLLALGGLLVGTKYWARNNEPGYRSDENAN